MRDMQFTPSQIRYLKLLRREYRTIQEASAELAHLRAIQKLPKGTEHFLSDLHGEHGAFLHMLHNASGVIKRKINDLYGNLLSTHERDMLATLIYYPDEKLALLKRQGVVNNEWYRLTIYRLIEVCRVCSVKYTRKRVRDAMPKDMGALIEELMSADNTPDKDGYYREVMQSILETGQADALIIAFSRVIQALAIDRLHIIGDIFDRGPRADLIMDALAEYHQVDIQWGNHDIVWMGAAALSEVCIAQIILTSVKYANLETLEIGYGISLRPLATLANCYADDPCDAFHTKDNGEELHEDEMELARMHKAAAILQFKLEGQLIERHPEYRMEERRILHRIDYENKTVAIGGQSYLLRDGFFPTIDPENPYALTALEREVMDKLVLEFAHSEKLQRHARFLYSKGSLYRIFNGNLLFHGCIPMTEQGKLMSFSIGCNSLSGREFLDYADTTARRAYYNKPGSPERQFGMDFLWWLWCGRNSPIFGRDRMTTFERRFIADEETHTEPKNAYYQLYNDPAVCDMLLKEFGLEGEHCHIINGHMPVKSKKGESPIKGGGKLLVIDGGFCKAYQKTTGIAGYTLIYNSGCLRLVSHEPFSGREDAIRRNRDIVSSSVVFERMESRQKIAGTDIGRQLQDQIDNLMALLQAFRSGAIVESHK